MNSCGSVFPDTGSIILHRRCIKKEKTRINHFFSKNPYFYGKISNFAVSLQYRTEGYDYDKRKNRFRHKYNYDKTRGRIVRVIEPRETLGMVEHLNIFCSALSRRQDKACREENTVILKYREHF